MIKLFSACACAIFFATGTASAAGKTTGSVVNVTGELGQVLLSRGVSTQPISEDAILFEGDRIVTLSEGTVTIRSEDCEYELASNNMITFDSTFCVCMAALITGTPNQAHIVPVVSADLPASTVTSNAVTTVANAPALTTATAAPAIITNASTVSAPVIATTTAGATGSAGLMGSLSAVGLTATVAALSSSNSTGSSPN